MCVFNMPFQKKSEIFYLIANKLNFKEKKAVIFFSTEISFQGGGDDNDKKSIACMRRTAAAANYACSYV